MSTPLKKKSEYVFGAEELQKPSAVLSQYAVSGLENIVTLEANPIYLREPILAKSQHGIPGIRGVPISASTLRQKIAILENKIYIPTILNGVLYFVSNDDDTRTAVSEAVEPTFTLSQLKNLLGSEIEHRLKRSMDFSSDMSFTGSELSSRSRSVSPFNAPTRGVQTAVSRTLLTGVGTLSDHTAASRTMLTATDTLSERTAASQTIFTASEKSDTAVTALSDGLLTARGSEPNLALLHTPKSGLKNVAQSFDDTMTACEN